MLYGPPEGVEARYCSKPSALRHAKIKDSADQQE